MFKRSVFFCSLLFFLLMLGDPSFAQSYRYEIGIKADNDFYIDPNQDRYYTDGIFFNFRQALIPKKFSDVVEKKILEVEIGQKIYNPFWSNAPDPATHDRPFAGYSYIGGALSWFLKNEAVIRAGAQLGILGPASKAEQIQTEFHEKILKSYYPVAGWEYQVKNEVGLNTELSYQQLLLAPKKRFFDLAGTSTIQLGNTFSGLNAGVVLRVGKINPFYESAYGNSRLKAKDNKRTRSELFLFTQPSVNFVAYDATIQGGLFRADKGPVTFSPRRLVYAQQLGLNFAWDRFNAKYIATFRSKEVKSEAKAYRFAGIIVSYHFN